MAVDSDRGGVFRVVGCFAHADDAELWSGGTLCRHIAAGHEVTLAYFDTGEPARLVEAREAASVLGGARLTVLDRDEKWFRGADRDLDRLLRLISEVRPDLIVTHPTEDTHIEHVRVAELVSKATIRGQDMVGRPIWLYETSSYGGTTRAGLFSPDVLVDISDVWERKVEAIRCFRSQDPETLLQLVDAQTRFYGGLCGVQRAEGFRRVSVLGVAHEARCVLGPRRLETVPRGRK